MDGGRAHGCSGTRGVGISERAEEAGEGSAIAGVMRDAPVHVVRDGSFTRQTQRPETQPAARVWLYKLELLLRRVVGLSAICQGYRLDCCLLCTDGRGQAVPDWRLDGTMSSKTGRHEVEAMGSEGLRQTTNAGTYGWQLGG